jgi:hypothetical protein
MVTSTLSNVFDAIESIWFWVYMKNFPVDNPRITSSGLSVSAIPTTFLLKFNVSKNPPENLMLICHQHGP